MTPSLMHDIGVVITFAFLACIGATAYLLMTAPDRIVRITERKGIYIPFLELMKTRGGRVQVRLFGFVFLVVSLYMFVFVVASLARR